MKLNPNIAARERNHATQPGRAGSPLPAAKGDKVSALPASSRRRARSVAPYPRLNSLRTLRSFAAIAASFLFAGTVARARRGHHPQSVPAVAGPADEGLNGCDAMSGHRASQCRRPRRVQTAGGLGRANMNPSTPKTEPPPSTRFRKAVFGGAPILSPRHTPYSAACTKSRPPFVSAERRWNLIGWGLSPQR